MYPGTPPDEIAAWRAERDATRARLGFGKYDKHRAWRLYLPSPRALYQWDPSAAFCWFPILERARGIDTLTLALALLEEPERVAAWQAVLGSFAGERGFPDEGWTFHAWGAWMQYWNDWTLPEAFRRANSTAIHRVGSYYRPSVLPPSPATISE